MGRLACSSLSRPLSPCLPLRLFLLGVFSAIYHPIGSAMIVANARQLGRALGVNGVWGNIGAALASGITAALAASFGWRAAFLAPGAVLIGTGIAFVLFVKDDRATAKKGTASHTLNLDRKRVIWLLTLFMTAILAGGLTFNIVTIAMPKVIDERLGLPVSLAVTGWLTTSIFFCGALTQILVGRLVDRFELPVIFVGLALLQFSGLVIAAATIGLPMALGLTLVTAAIYGQVVVNDAMIGRYVPDEFRNRIYSVRFFIGFTVGGMAVPIIGALHRVGGFGEVLMAAAAIAASSLPARWQPGSSLVGERNLPLRLQNDLLGRNQRRFNRFPKGNRGTRCGCNLVPWAINASPQACGYRYDFIAVCSKRAESGCFAGGAESHSAGSARRGAG